MPLLREALSEGRELSLPPAKEADAHTDVDEDEDGLREKGALRELLAVFCKVRVPWLLPLEHVEAEAQGELVVVMCAEHESDDIGVTENDGRGLREARALAVPSPPLLAEASTELLRDTDGESECVLPVDSLTEDVAECGALLEGAPLDCVGSEVVEPAPPLLPLEEPHALFMVERLPRALELREGGLLAVPLWLPLLEPLMLLVKAEDGDASVVGEAMPLAEVSTEGLGGAESEAASGDGEPRTLDVDEVVALGEILKRVVVLGKTVGVAPPITLGVPTLLAEPDEVPPAPPI